VCAQDDAVTGAQLFEKREPAVAMAGYRAVAVAVGRGGSVNVARAERQCRARPTAQHGAAHPQPRHLELRDRVHVGPAPGAMGTPVDQVFREGTGDQHFRHARLRRQPPLLRQQDAACRNQRQGAGQNDAAHRLTP
jgi:hypothetical protein